MRPPKSEPPANNRLLASFNTLRPPWLRHQLRDFSIDSKARLRSLTLAGRLGQELDPCGKARRSCASSSDNGGCVSAWERSGHLCHPPNSRQSPRRYIRRIVRAIRSFQSGTLASRMGSNIPIEYYLLTYKRTTLPASSHWVHMKRKLAVTRIGTSAVKSYEPASTLPRWATVRRRYL